MHKVLRILHVMGRLDRGGAETMVMNIYRKLDKTKFQFDFVVHTKEKCAYDDEITKLGGRIFSVCSYKGVNHIEYVKQWRKFLCNHSYEIIHCHIRSTAVIILYLARRNNMITISHSHSLSSGSGIRAIIKNLYQLPIRLCADYYLSCSLEAGIWLFGKKICSSSKFEILPNAIDLDRFKFSNELRLESRIELQLLDGFVVGNIGRFETVKNHKRIIAIFKIVHDKDKNAKLILVGDGKLKSEIVNMVEDLGLSKSVLFLGSRSDIPKLLCTMDIFLFPSIFEGLGMVTIEAQAVGLPCIVSDVIPKEAFITNLLQPLSLKDQDEKWAKAILKCKLRHDTSQIEKLRLAGYDVINTTKQLESIYTKLIQVNNE